MKYSVYVASISYTTLEAATPTEAVEKVCDDYKIQLIQICYHQDINILSGIVDLDNGTLRTFKVEAK